MNLFGRSIRKRVMEAVEVRIREGQEELDNECQKEDERMAEGIRAITDAASRAKDDAEKRIVSRIIG